MRRTIGEIPVVCKGNDDRSAAPTAVFLSCWAEARGRRRSEVQSALPAETQHAVVVRRMLASQSAAVTFTTDRATHDESATRDRGGEAARGGDRAGRGESRRVPDRQGGGWSG